MDPEVRVFSHSGLHRLLLASGEAYPVPKPASQNGAHMATMVLFGTRGP